MASRKLFDPSTALYQWGRGSDPMIEVGRVTPADALYIVSSPVSRYGSSRSDAAGSIVERLALGRRLAVLEQRAVGLRQRRAGIAEAVDDRIAAVAAEIPQRHLDAGRRLPALVLGEVEHARDLHHGLALEAGLDDLCDWLLVLDEPLKDAIEHVVGRQRILVGLVFA